MHKPKFHGAIVASTNAPIHCLICAQAPTDHEVTDPRDGNLTVEDDRAAIDVLCLVADDLRSRLYLSAVSQMFSEANLDEAMGKGWHNQDNVPDALRQNIIET